MKRHLWFATIAASDGLVHLVWSYPRDDQRALGETACEEVWCHLGTSVSEVPDDIVRGIDTDEEPTCLTCIATELFA